MDPLKVLLCASRTSYLVSSLILWFGRYVKHRATAKTSNGQTKVNSITVSEEEDS